MKALLDLAVIATVTMALSLPVVAQSGSAADPGPIPAATVQSAAALSADQQRSVDDYVKHHTARLTSDQDDAVTAAKSALIYYFDTGGSEPFSLYYSAAVSRALDTGGAVRSADPMVAINAMVVVSKLRDAGLLPLVQSALERQDNPAVRYWAGQAIRSWVERVTRGNSSAFTAEQRKLVPMIQQAMTDTTSAPVVEQLLGALVVMRIPEARDALSGLLLTRADALAQAGSASAAPEAAALRQLFQDLVVEVSTAGPGAAQSPALLQTLKRMAKLSERYLALAVSQLQRSDLPAAAIAEYRALAVQIADQFLPYLAKHLGVTDLPARRMDSAIPGGSGNLDLTLAKLIATEWGDRLSKPPFTP
jgi:hypothetical protein